MTCTASAATSSGPTTRAIDRRGAELIAALFELSAEERRRQGCVDEAGGDQIHSNRSDLERQAGREGRERTCRRRADPDTDAWVARPCAAHEQKRASGPDLLGRSHRTSRCSARRACSPRVAAARNYGL